MPFERTLRDNEIKVVEERHYRLVPVKVRIPVKPATESGANRPGRSEATPEVDNHLRSGRFESIHRSLLG